MAVIKVIDYFAKPNQFDIKIRFRAYSRFSRKIDWESLMSTKDLSQYDVVVCSIKTRIFQLNKRKDNKLDHCVYSVTHKYKSEMKVDEGGEKERSTDSKKTIL